MCFLKIRYLVVVNAFSEPRLSRAVTGFPLIAKLSCYWAMQKYNEISVSRNAIKRHGSRLYGATTARNGRRRPVGVGLLRNVQRGQHESAPEDGRSAQGAGSTGAAGREATPS